MNKLPYNMTMVLGSEDAQAIESAINQGIDSRLNAISFEYSIDNARFFPRMSVNIESSSSLAVLLYRLWEAWEDGDCEASGDLFNGICDTLGLEDPWLVDNYDAVMPDIYYGSYEHIGKQFIGPLDKIVEHCIDRGSAPTKGEFDD